MAIRSYFFLLDRRSRRDTFLYHHERQYQHSRPAQPLSQSETPPRDRRRGAAHREGATPLPPDPIFTCECSDAPARRLLGAVECIPAQDLDQDPVARTARREPWRPLRLFS